MEWLTVVALLMAAIYLILAIYKGPRNRGWNSFWGVTAAFLFFVALEEIDWGQRIFGWDAGPTFENNLQGATNIHNFFNQEFWLVYPLAGLGIVLPWILGLVAKGRIDAPWERILPHPTLLVVGMPMIICAFIAQQEAFEASFAVFSFLYARILCQGTDANHVGKPKTSRL